MAVKRNLIIDQGETVIMDFTWRTKVSKTPVDITGADILLQIRLAAEVSSSLLFEASTDNGSIVITDGAAGEFQVTLTSAQTTAMGPSGVPSQPTQSPAVYEMKLKFADGRVRSLMIGNVIFNKAVAFL